MKLNSSISNGTFVEKKKQILEHSAINLNRQLAKIEEWNEEEIVARAGRLFDVARGVWPYPTKEA